MSLSLTGRFGAGEIRAVLASADGTGDRRDMADANNLKKVLLLIANKI